MRSVQWILILVLFSLGIPVLTGVVSADTGNYSPTMIIPTKYRLLLIDMIQSADQPPVQAPRSIPEEEPPVSSKAEAVKSSLSDEDILDAGIVPDNSYNGYGRGYVETNFDVSFEEPGRRIDNRERLTARGLFDVHVSHGFN